MHQPDDPALGQPLCPDCYDYESHVLWQWWAPELWRRFTIALKRRLAQLLGADLDRLGDVASLQYAKVAEYQVRGAVHFHALIRLDGPPDADRFAPAPSEVTASVLAQLVEQVAAEVTLSPSRSPRMARPGCWRSARRSTPASCGPLGAPTTPMPRSAPSRSPATWPSTRRSPRPTPRPGTTHTCGGCTPPPGASPPRPTPHRTPPSPYRLLGRWAHTLGFRGHFSTKSRRYSVTLGRLRRARQRAQIRIAAAARAGTTVDLRDLEAELLADDTDEATLVIGSWAYAGSGWANAGETALATAAAARAREYARRRACARRTTHNTESSDTGKG